MDEFAPIGTKDTWARMVGVALFCCLMSGSRLFAQTPAEAAPPAAETVTADQITALQNQVATIADLTEDQKKRAGELAQQALADIQAVETYKADAAKYAADTKQVPQHLQDVERNLSQLKKANDPAIESGASVSELETERNAAQQQITQLEQQLGLPSADPTARTARRRAARQFLIDYPQKAQQVNDLFAVAPAEGEPAALTSLRQARLRAELLALQGQAAAAQNELALLDAEDAVGLPTLLRELLTRQLTRLRKQVELQTSQINRLRQQEAAQRVEEARAAAMQAQPLLKPILEANERIALEEAEIRKEHEAVQTSGKDLEQKHTELRKEFQDIQSLDKQFGLTASVGIRLRELRSQLPSARFHQAQRKARIATLEQAQFNLYQRSDELDDLGDIEANAAEIVAASTGLDEKQREALSEGALTALRTQYEYLDKVINAYRNYTDTLTQLDLHEQELIELIDRFADFIDERVLWVRSHRSLQLSDLLDDRQSFSWMWGISSWQSLGRAILQDIAQVPALYAAVGALIVFLLVLHRRIGHHLRELTKQAQSRVTVSLLPTVRATEFTVLSAIIGPGLLWFLGWRLWQSPEASRIVLAVAVSLTRLAGVFLLLELVRQSMRPHGLCEVHFGLRRVTARRIRRRLRQLLSVGLPLAAAVALTHFHNGDGRQAPIERLLFIAAMLLLAYVAHMLLRRGGDLQELQAFRGNGWIGQLRSFWYLLVVGLPLMLAGLTAAGYYYSAQQLAARCQISLCLLLGLVYLRASLFRWLMLRHRRLRLQQFRDRQASEAAATSDEAATLLPEPPLEETDLDSIGRQSQRLVSTTFVVASLLGVWMIWSDVVPAFRFLDRWPLWEYTVQIREESTNVDGNVKYETKEVLRSVTIVHLAFASLVFVLTMTAARNLPGLLEITLLQRLPLDRSTTYAITALMRYSIVLIGILLASQTLGIGWAKVQWLAAALTFGLGFGLQEIFANFVSGIIILFEQPVRVGDVVTIDDISGVVNRIRIRATTIVNWDRKEYIVPNREFITGRLLNWTLSDKTNRVMINVGVAYGSDTALVRETILAVAREHGNVLEDPEPLVTFEGFGDSALDFVLRAYLPNLDARLQTVDDLHTAIDNRFKAAGIEIAFPQRDLHLRTPVVLTNNAMGGANGQPSPTPPQTTDLAPS